MADAAPRMSIQSSPMTGRIPQQFIDELMSRIDIVALIDARVPLRKTGQNYSARCPFHEEKSPSFTVSPTKQFYHCFGCEAHGTAIGFLMAYEHLDFVEAVQELAQQAGLELPRLEQATIAAPNIPVYETLERTALYFRQQLRQHPQAVEYLKQRGLTGTIAAEFGIGYAPPGWSNLLQHLAASSTVTAAHLLEAGLVVQKDQGGHYDRFRDRIMFPIRDRRGRVVGFGGRVLDKASTPKYLNSPETDVFHKGRELYGLFEAQQALRRLDRLLVVEGYMDVVALAQHDIRYAVATLGTATTEEHVERLFRAAPEVIFCFDGDRAGRAAAQRALEHTLPALRGGRQARVLFLPEGEDPDSLVRREGKTQFEQRIVQSVPLSVFFYEGLIKRTDISNMEGRARLIELARPLLSKLAPGVLRHIMVNRLAELAQVEERTLTQLLAAKRESLPTPPPATPRAVQGPGGGLSPLRLGLKLLMHSPVLAERADDPGRWRELSIRGIGLWINVLELLREHPHLTGAAVIERWRDTQAGQMLSELACGELAIPSEGYEAEFVGIVRWLDNQLREQRWTELHTKSQREGLTREEKREFVTLQQANREPPEGIYH